DRSAQQWRAVTPKRRRFVGCILLLPPHRHDGDECGEFVRRRLTAYDTQQRSLGVRRAVAHSGMFPCFFGGSDSRLLRSARSALMTCTRVSLGGMTASM